MSDKIYTKSETGKKWHIRQHPSAIWTLCYELCAYWNAATDELIEPGEVCQQCQAINEAIRTGEGVPF